MTAATDTVKVPARARSVSDAPAHKRQAASRSREAARVYDIRIAVDFPEHRKTTKLRYLLEARQPGINLGDKAFRCLIQLWARAGKRHRSGTVNLSIEDLEIEAGWRDMLCPPEHHGWFVSALIKAGFLVEVQADGAYELHDWAEHQPWVTEGIVASVSGRFHKQVGLGRAQGLSHEEALRRAHDLVPEFAQLTKTTLEDQLDEIAAAQEQLEIDPAVVGPSREAILGEKPTPKARARSAPSKLTLDQLLQRVPVPDQMDPIVVRRILEHRAGTYGLKINQAKALMIELAEAKNSGVDLQKLLEFMVRTGYTDVSQTVRWNGHRVRAESHAQHASSDAAGAPLKLPPAGPSRTRSADKSTRSAEDERLNALFAQVGIDLTSQNVLEQFIRVTSPDSSLPSPDVRQVD